MRLKFEKGMTPEKMARAFLEFVNRKDIIIGSVNMYIQTYDEEMKLEKFSNDEFFLVQPSEATKIEYGNYIANKRRERIKAV